MRPAPFPGLLVLSEVLELLGSWMHPNLSWHKASPFMSGLHRAFFSQHAPVSVPLLFL